MKTRQRFVRLECETLEDRVTPATLTWTGAVDGLWSHAGNWTTDDVTRPVPQDGDAIVFPAQVGNRTQTDDLGQRSFASLTFYDGGYNLSGDPFVLTAGLTANANVYGTIQVANDISFSFQGGTQVVALGDGVDLRLTGGVGLLAGSGLRVEGGMIAMLSIGGTLTISGNMAVDANVEILGIVSVPGLLQIQSASRVDIAAGAFLYAYGTVNIDGGQLYIAGVASDYREWTMDGGLLLIESGGQFAIDVSSANSVTPFVVNSGEVYDAGLILVTSFESSSPSSHQTGRFELRSAAAYLVVAPGGELYTSGVTQTTAGAQIYDFGTILVAAGGTNNGWGLYVYDSVLTVESGGTLYAYGTTAIEADSALYDYGTLVLEPNGYLYNADLVVIEQGGVFYKYGTFFMAPGSTYYNFGQQIGG